MNMNKKDIIEALYEATEKSFKSLLAKHKDEHFYYFTLVMADACTPCISAQSKESLKRYMDENGYDESETIDFKWSWADSPYCAYGYEEFFGTVEEIFTQSFDEAEDSDEEYAKWLTAMEQVMKMLDETGIFGSEKDREEIFIFAEESPPDDESDEYQECARRMNPKSVYEMWMNDQEM